MSSIDSEDRMKSPIARNDSGTDVIAVSKPKPTLQKRPIWRMILSQLAGVIWLAAITVLLVFNFRGWIIGASVSCGLKKNCDYDPFRPDAFEEAEKMDKRDHNILGALQFVAKALEVCFMALAASLVYDLTMLLAAKDDGLPVGYMMCHVEFADVMSLGQRTFWASAKQPSRDGRKNRTVILYAFVVFVALMCLLANLMGPATAVLVIPSLGWSQVDMHIGQRFAQSGAANPPNNASIAAGCQPSALAAGNYSCTNIYSGTLDSFTSSLVASTDQKKLDSILGTVYPGISQEALLTFFFNFSDPNAGFFVPSRQVLRELSNDYAAVALTKVSDIAPNVTRSDIEGLAEKDYNRTISSQVYNSFRNSLQQVLHRSGPTISLNGYCYRGNSTLINLTDDRSVRCFNGSNYWTDFPVKCIQEGSGWNNYNAHAQFSINDISRPAGPASVDIYATEHAVYLSGNRISCSLENTPQGAFVSDASCDWNAIFAETQDLEMKNMTQSQQVIEYNIPRASGTNATIWCDSFSYLNFTDYTLDPSPITNALNLIGISSLSNVTGTNPVNVHPDWTLAAWSIAKGGIVDADREAAQDLISSLKALASSVTPNDPNANDPDMVLFALQHFFIAGQGVSMIDYSTTPVTDLDKTEKDPTHPVLKVYVIIQVWAYGLGSRTSKVGTVVAFCGIFVVLVRAFLGFFTRIKRKRTLELFAAALEHDQEGRFEGFTSEHEIAKVRFRTNTKNGGKVEFVPIT